MCFDEQDQCIQAFDLGICPLACGQSFGISSSRSWLTAADSQRERERERGNKGFLAQSAEWQAWGHCVVKAMDGRASKQAVPSPDGRR